MENPDMSMSTDAIHELVAGQNMPEPTYDTAAPRNRFGDEMRALYRYRHLISNLIRRDITVRYKRSALGVIWTLLDPLLTMLVMSVVFGALFQRSIAGFPVFLLSGLIVWNFFSQTTTQAMLDLKRSSSLIGKVNLPLSIFSITALGSGLINFLISLIPLSAMMMVFNIPMRIPLFILPISVLILGFFTLGVELIVSTLGVFFEDTVNFYTIALRLVFYLSGVIYRLDMLPDVMRKVIGLIPTYHLVTLFRLPIYDGTLPDVASLLYASLWAAALFLIGFWVFTRYSDEYIYRI